MVEALVSSAEDACSGLMNGNWMDGALDEIQGLIRTGDGRISRRLAGNSCQYRARHSMPESYGGLFLGQAAKIEAQIADSHNFSPKRSAGQLALPGGITVIRFRRRLAPQ
jgi:hypothetical protein